MSVSNAAFYEYGVLNNDHYHELLEKTGGLNSSENRAKMYSIHGEFYQEEKSYSPLKGAVAAAAGAGITVVALPILLKGAWMVAENTFPSVKSVRLKKLEIQGYHGGKL